MRTIKSAWIDLSYCTKKLRIFLGEALKEFSEIAFLEKNRLKSLCNAKKALPLQPHLARCFFARARNNAAIAQLVERDLAKVEVAGPSPVCRSFL